MGHRLHPETKGRICFALLLLAIDSHAILAKMEIERVNRILQIINARIVEAEYRIGRMLIAMNSPGLSESDRQEAGVQFFRLAIRGNNLNLRKHRIWRAYFDAHLKRQSVDPTLYQFSGIV